MARRVVTGWKLDLADRARLLDLIPALFPDIVADHVTLRSGTDGDTPLPRETTGEVVGVVDDGLGIQALVVRIGGTTARADGSIFHITWSLDQAKGRRAVESNQVLADKDWKALAQPIAIRLIPARF
ncbi:hypothetical protein [uncultured Novosphingobium sp.]|uniref:hypothetical protein n=1 Tax=uncultured Novosphingobium sp. TaxID=292277 RepID=UPI002582A6FC|nr:hypothetical protein [uncultured Novosphingobium sp.]